MDRPKILYLTHRVPFPPNKGDRIRTFHILRFLARRADVYLGSLADEPVTDAVLAELDKYCREICIARVGGISRASRMLWSLLCGRTISEGAFASRRLSTVLSHWAARIPFTGVLASASSLVPHLRRAGLRDLPIVVDLIDVDSQKWLDYAAVRRWPSSWLFRTEARRLRRLEQDLSTWARAVTTVSDAETNLYRSFAPGAAAYTVTNGVDLDFFHAPSPRPVESGCVFVGALDYYPNVDAACWFCRAVWPEIMRRRPQARLALVGRRPVPAIRHLTEVPGVELLADVPDVRPHLARAAVAVVPLRVARGVQNKVLEALAMGKAVVAAPQALAALGTEPGQHLLAAASRGEWADAIQRLLDDEPLRRGLGDAGRRFVRQHHHWDRCLAPLGGLLGLPDLVHEPRRAVFMPAHAT